MKISRTVAYAVQAALQLAHAPVNTPVPCSQLAAEGKMPERFLLQILRSLVTHGILDSTRGVDGGYTLLRGPEDVSLLEILEAIDGPLKTHMPAGNGFPEDAQEKLEVVFGRVTLTARDTLGSVKLAELMTHTPA